MTKELPTQPDPNQAAISEFFSNQENLVRYEGLFAVFHHGEFLGTVNEAAALEYRQLNLKLPASERYITRIIKPRNGKSDITKS